MWQVLSSEGYVRRIKMASGWSYCKRAVPGVVVFGAVPDDARVEHVRVRGDLWSRMLPATAVIDERPS